MPEFLPQHLMPEQHNQSHTNHSAFVLWLTGLSGSGKTTIADKLYEQLAVRCDKVEKLDGDQIRKLFGEAGFTRADRDRHIRHIGFLASRLEKHGVIVIASFISPYEQARGFVRNLCENFIEVYVQAPLSECERRDVKGLYSKARAGGIKNFTGIDDPYEPPERPEITLHTDQQTAAESTAVVMQYLRKYI